VQAVSEDPVAFEEGYEKGRRDEALRWQKILRDLLANLELELGP
jgi:hypothetical protein